MAIGELDQVTAIITRTKDRPILLARAIRSVLGQSNRNWIHVIVNDGGSRTSVEDVLEKYRAEYNGKLIVIHNETSVGMEAASNIGINSCSSKYVTIHDDDDSWEPDFLKLTTQALQNKAFRSIKGVVTHTNHILERLDGNNVSTIWTRDFDPWLESISITTLSEINKFMPISFLYERDALDATGFYDESLPVCGDWEFNIRFILNYDILVIKEKLANYHLREAAPGHYSNTVTAGQDKHVLYRSMIINKHIRNSVQKGQLDVGTILLLGDHSHRNISGTWRILTFIERLKNNRVLRTLRRIARV